MTYYVYVVDRNYYIEMSFHELRQFVLNNDKGIFGNHPRQMRLRKERYNSYFFEKFATYYHKKTQLIDYIAYDESFNLIDYKILENCIYNYIYNTQLLRKRKKDFEFRNGPVEGTSRTRSYRHNIRHPKTTNERRITSDKTHKKYSRGKRRNLPDYYDDIRRSSDYTAKSWKSKKVRKQYLKNL